MTLDAYLDSFSRRDWRTDGVDESDGPVRFAFVGLGWWTVDRAIPAAAASELCEPAVAVSSSTEKAERVAGEHDMATGITYDEFHDGVASDDYDAVYVCTPNALHLQYVETAAELDRAVLCEKPMEATAERAERLVEAGADVPLMVGYRMHTDPAARRMRELVRDGAVGEPAHVHGHMTQPLMEMIPDPDQWRLNPDLAGEGGSVTDLGVYPINTTRFVLDRDPESVTAMMHSERGEYESVPDERASFQVEYEGGVYAACSASQNAHHSGQLKVVGTEGTLTLEPAFFNRDHKTLTLERDGQTAELVPGTVDQMEEEFAYFADRVLGDGTIEPDGEHGLVDVRTIEAVYESARAGERTEV